MKFAACPGDCGQKVAIREHNNVNFCCAPCWDEVWGIVKAGMDGNDPRPRIFPHSDQCLVRQALRVDEPFQEGEYRILGKSQRDKLNGHKT